MEISAPIQPQTQILGLFILLLCFISSINLCSCQSNVPLNVQVIYPWLPPTSPVSAPSPAPVSPPLHQPTPTPVSSTPPLPPETSPKPPLHLPPPPPPPPPMASAPPPSSSVSNKAIYTAVGVTAASTLIVAGLLLLFCNKYTSRRRGDQDGSGGGGNGGNTPMLQPQTEFARFEGQVRGLIVDENGVDVVYWRRLEGSQKKGSFRREVYERPNSGKRSFNRLRSSTSNNQVHPGRDDQGNLDGGGGGAAFPPPFPPLLPPSGRASTRVEPSRTWLDSAPVPQTRQPANLMAIPKEKPPIHVESPTSPTSAAPMVATKNPTSPAPPPSLPPAGRGKNPAPTPPSPTEARELVPSKPPSVPEQTSTSNEIAVASSSETRDDQVKLKRLHLEKVKVNTDHSMVWDKTDKSSVRYNGDLMEALFGYVATNRKSPKHSNLTNKKAAEPNPSAKKIILEAQRSQNIAIVLRSLGVSRTELIGNLLGGKGLNSETLQKLAQITPTKEESSQILGYNGDPTRLADAEFFLYHLLKAVPSAFIRANAMLFRLNYDYEVFQLRESQKTLELACSELGIRGVFLKLLEAILKAGNRLNAGTSRGDAKVFSLSTLLKLSDYKSSDGKTTLLHFVVHEVVRNEGRRCVLTRGNSVSHRENRNNSSMSYPQSGISTISKEEQEREFIKLGLLEVGGLGAELSNVKKAATIHHETLANTITSLTARVAEVQQLVAQCGSDSQDKGRFAEEMQGFIQSATEELKAIKDEQTRVMDFVKRTNQYYQSGSSKDKQPLQLFVMVNGFLNMVDQTCVEIARSLRHKKPAGNKDAASSSADGYPTSQQPDVLRTRVTFPRLPAHFLSDKSSSSGSDDEG